MAAVVSGGVELVSGAAALVSGRAAAVSTGVAIVFGTVSWESVTGAARVSGPRAVSGDGRRVASPGSTGSGAK